VSAVSDKNGTCEGIRLFLRHLYWWLVLASVIIVPLIGYAFGLHKAAVVGLAFYAPLTTAWFYSTTDMVHGPGFSKLSVTAKINTVLRLAGLLMSGAAFYYTVPTLF
jgi:hypothetical protein